MFSMDVCECAYVHDMYSAVVEHCGSHTTCGNELYCVLLVRGSGGVCCVISTRSLPNCESMRDSLISSKQLDQPSWSGLFVSCGEVSRVYVCMHTPSMQSLRTASPLDVLLSKVGVMLGFSGLHWRQDSTTAKQCHPKLPECTP